MSVRNNVEVKIGGTNYKLVGVESQEYIQKVGNYIDKKLNEVLKSSTMLSTSMASVLTAVNVADDYFKSAEAMGKMKFELQKAYEEVEKIKNENLHLYEKSEFYKNELNRKEYELGDIRNTVERNSKIRLYAK